MPVRVEEIPLSKIWINREHRQRRFFETTDLEKSIPRNGLINPIVLIENPGPGGQPYELKAGERRLTACQNLGHETILARFFEDLTETQQQIIELEENLKRSDLEWNDQARAILRIHKLFLAEDPDWTLVDTSEALSITKGYASMNIRVARELEAKDERVEKAGTVREAYNILNRRDARKAGDLLEELLATPDAPSESLQAKLLTDLSPPGAKIEIPRNVDLPSVETRRKVADASESILEESFLDWIETYEGPPFNLLHCDFPYGIEVFRGRQGVGAESTIYNDAKEIYFELLETMLRNIDKILSHSAHVMFWYSETHGDETRRLFRTLAPTFDLLKFPLIWTKSDNAGIASDSRRTPRHVYETCLVASRGRRQIVRNAADSYSSPMDKKLHPSTKPEPMLRHFMQMFCDEHTSLLDPTCGSGAALRAAESLGARRVLGLEIDEGYAAAARQELQKTRLLRSSSL
jgi:ParB-like chromosome segregation protein Spo0J